jgi:hypothetical protein
MLKIDRMKDTCTPANNFTLKTYRIYSIIIPALIFILIIEAIYVFMKLPSTFGSATTMKLTLTKG